MNDDSDELASLAEGLHRCDPDAWEALYRRVHGTLLGYAVRRLGEREAAEDAVSETMTRALRNIDRYEVRQPAFDAWLVGILRNVVHEAWRARGRLDHPAHAHPPAPVADAGPDERLLLDEEAAAVRIAFAALEADEQEVLELRVVQGLPAAEVAAATGRTAGAVRMAQHRALGRLRQIVGDTRGD